MKKARARRLWWLLGACVLAWVGSWRVLHLEVTRWHHMDRRLRFTPPPVLPDAPPPKAGLPVITAVAVAVTAPLGVVVAALLLVRQTRGARRR